MEKPHSQANQTNSACPSTFNGGVTVLPCSFHHNPLPSAAFKVSRTPPAPNTSLCHHLSLTINQINRFINAINACSRNKSRKEKRKNPAMNNQLISCAEEKHEILSGNFLLVFGLRTSPSPQCSNVLVNDLVFPKHRKCTLRHTISL